MEPLKSVQRVAILIPCYNEAPTVAQVVREFRQELPQAEVYVYDNGSTDETAQEAQRAGAIVRRESRRGKGYVLRSMFRTIEADVYVMVDGDLTYPADAVQALIDPILSSQADMVIGSRLQADTSQGFSWSHLIGNRIFRFLLNWLFHVRITDLLSGYRAMTRDVVKGIPFFSRGFEIETELTVKCLDRGYQIVEVPVTLVARRAGS